MPVRLTAGTRSQASGVMSMTEANVSTPAPVTVTVTVIGPYASRTAWITAATTPRSETSQA